MPNSDNGSDFFHKAIKGMRIVDQMTSDVVAVTRVIISILEDSRLELPQNLDVTSGESGNHYWQISVTKEKGRPKRDVDLRCAQKVSEGHLRFLFSASNNPDSEVKTSLGISVAWESLPGLLEKLIEKVPTIMESEQLRDLAQAISCDQRLKYGT